MEDRNESLASRVETSYQKLSGVAADLNFSSDELGKSVADLDASLKKLNLGVATWIQVRGEMTRTMATFGANN